MPGGHSNPRVRILERLVLKPAWMESQLAPEREQPFLVGTDQVDHRLVIDLVAMKPNAAAQGEAHPLATASKLGVRRLYVQVMRPSTVAGGTGEAPPSKRVQYRDVCEWTAFADHPCAVASVTVSVTPADALKLFSAAKLLV